MRPIRTFLIALSIAAAVLPAGLFAQDEPNGEIDVAALRKRILELAKNDTQSELFSTISKAVMPSVVVVRTTRRVDIPTGADGLAEKGLHLYRFTLGQGSGVIIDAEKGYVLTNFHVVGRAQRVEVVLHDGRILRASWIRGDRLSDLAVVKIPPGDLVGTPLGDSDTLEVGDQVLAFGAPMGLPQTVTSGIVSAKSRQTFLSGTSYQDFIQTDASINRGNSGGPLVNMRGEVVGINTMILSSTGMNAGVGLAIPSNMARAIMAQLISTGIVVRGYLGLQIQDVTMPLAKNMSLPDNRGAMVCRVMRNSPAEKAGLELEDFIVGANGKTITGANQLRNIIAGIHPGETVTLDILRGGKPQKITMVVGSLRTKDAMRPKTNENVDIQRRIGILGETLTPELCEKYKYPVGTQGILITEVAYGSEAYEANLDKGMVITHINGQSVTTVDRLDSAVRANMGKGIRLTVINQKDGRWLALLPLEIF